MPLGKPTFLFRDDFRRCTDSENYPLNLMLFTGLPEDGWEAYYYTSLAEISAPDKALARWLRDELKLTYAHEPFPPICSKTQKLKRPKRSCAPASTAAFAMPPAPPTCSPATNSKGRAAAFYLIKSMLEEDVPPSRQTVEHIDNCLGCLACETTCPSGVDYSLLLETARPRLDQLVKRPLADRLLRAC